MSPLAQRWIADFESAATATGKAWYPPHHTVQQGMDVFEWWRGQRSLSLLVDTEVNFQFSGPGAPLSDRKDISTPELRNVAWRWLNEEAK